MRRAPLGDLWRPKYFRGGIAIHGAASIPGPAGVARLRPRVEWTPWTWLWSSGLARARHARCAVY